MPKLEQPAGNASTDDWRAFALQEDPGSADAIEEMGRDELRDRYAAPEPEGSDDGPAATPDDPGQFAAPAAPAAAAFQNVTPPTPTEVPAHVVYRVSISEQLWDLDAVEFPYATDDDPGATFRVSRAAPALVSEAEADALIQAAGERGFALTKEKVA